MKVSYQFVCETVEVEVEEVWGEMLMDMDRKEYNNDHKETRRHASLDEIDQDDNCIPAKDNVEEEILQKESKNELLESLQHLTPEQLCLVKKVYFEGRTLVSIAIEEGVSKAAITYRMKVINEKLKKVLI